MKTVLKTLAAALIAGVRIGRGNRRIGRLRRRRNRAAPRRGAGRRTRSRQGVRLCRLDPDVQHLRHAGDPQAGRARRSARCLPRAGPTDGNAYTFKLRADAKFQSGNPVTAEDVVFSLDRMKALGQGLSYLFTVVEKVEAVDAGTVKFTLSSPYAPFVVGAGAPADRRQEAGDGQSRRRRRRR